MVHKYLLHVVLVVLSILLISCHSNYVHLDLKTNFNPKPVFKYSDSSKIAFISTQNAYLRATGIAAFPDGGQPKVIYDKTGIYIYDSETEKLTYLMDLANLGTSWYIKKNAKLLYKDNFVYYNVNIDTLHTIDSEELALNKNKHNKCFSINVNTKEINPVDTEEFILLFQKFIKECNLTELNNKLKKIPLTEFGLVIQDIYPKSDKAYVDELIYAKSDGEDTRRAIIEQIISKLDKQEIKAILKKMDEYKNSLDGWDEVYEKSKYGYYLEKISKAIEELF